MRAASENQDSVADDGSIIPKLAVACPDYSVVAKDLGVTRLRGPSIGGTRNERPLRRISVQFGSGRAAVAFATDHHRPGYPRHLVGECHGGQFDSSLET